MYSILEWVLNSRELWSIKSLYEDCYDKAAVLSYYITESNTKAHGPRYRLILRRCWLVQIQYKWPYWLDLLMQISSMICRSTNHSVDHVVAMTIKQVSSLSSHIVRYKFYVKFSPHEVTLECGNVSNSIFEWLVFTFCGDWMNAKLEENSSRSSSSEGEKKWCDERAWPRQYANKGIIDGT